MLKNSFSKHICFPNKDEHRGCVLRVFGNPEMVSFEQKQISFCWGCKLNALGPEFIRRAWRKRNYSDNWWLRSKLNVSDRLSSTHIKTFLGSVWPKVQKSRIKTPFSRGHLENEKSPCQNWSSKTLGPCLKCLHRSQLRIQNHLLKIWIMTSIVRASSNLSLRHGSWRRMSWLRNYDRPVLDDRGGAMVVVHKFSDAQPSLSKWPHYDGFHISAINNYTSSLQKVSFKKVSLSTVFKDLVTSYYSKKF